MNKDNDSQELMDRRTLLTRAGIAGAGLVGAAVIAGCGGSSGGGSSQASASVDSANVAYAFQSIRYDEANHVDYLTTALGTSARPAPSFSAAALTAPDLSTFINDAAALENTGTGAYLYFATNTSTLSGSAALQAAAAVAIVEGRHAGFLNSLKSSGPHPLLTDPANDQTEPTNESLEVAQAPDEVNTRATPFLTGFALNGGPAPLTTAAAASASVVEILNYALFLEYLEANFYKINVQKFFGDPPAGLTPVAFTSNLT